MRAVKALLVASLILTLAACSSFRLSSPPKVTNIQVYKSERILLLLNNNLVVKKYKFKLGFAPVGKKQFEGDGKTPEGDYYIDRKNPNSKYYLSVGISYPNALDKANANGRSPGGDIFIHGTPRRFWFTKKDWTWGCIAVRNREIKEIYSMVEIGTKITIFP
ncbi:MAG: L,D-transpeptidase family protein [Planktomarina sp.]|nr:L,D-transpeptidase family protein [Planktomarina sp.]